MKLLLLKTLYKTILTVLPVVTYNSFTNNFFAPFQIQPYSTYVNYRLEPVQIAYLTAYVKNYTENLELWPIKLTETDNPDYFMSVNMYNCTSPLFVHERNITRCEINTYVRDSDGKFGTLILDYCSNGLSLDPVDFFKREQSTEFSKEDDLLRYFVENSKIKFSMKMKIDTLEEFIKKDFLMSKSLVQFTDTIFYKNGICDKLYYDSSLVGSVTKIPKMPKNMSFEYLGMKFDKIHSIFYFKNPIQFICGLWHNF